MTKIESKVKSIIENSSVKDALEYLKTDDEITLKTQRDLCKINAPSYMEGERAKAYKACFEEIGLEDVCIDTVGNVIGYIKGRSERPKLLLSAHMDTVFTEGTDTEVKIIDGIYHAPGICDNTRGMAEVLAVARAMKKFNIVPEGTIMFCGNVCEEGLGDLKGIKHLFKSHKDIDGYMTPDNGHVGAFRFSGTGSHRYAVTFKGTGGHSFGNFGIPNAIHALGRAIGKISDLKTPEEPKTTYSVGIIEGGISINTIAAEAKMLVDIRSNDHDSLLALEKEILSCINAAVDDENKRWDSDDLNVDIILIGDRPSGALNESEPIVQASIEVSKAMGIEYDIKDAGSTDANVPISLGIPAIQVGFGGSCGGIHTLKEWYNPEGSYMGPQKHLLTAITLVGLSDETEAVLKIRE